MKKPMLYGMVGLVAAAVAGYVAIGHHQERLKPATEETAQASMEPQAQQPQATEATPQADAPTTAGNAVEPAAQASLPEREEALAIQETDIVIGERDAPHTLLEYASLSCGHCAGFHKSVLPQLKKNLIETGKAKLVFRHYPLNAPAMQGALLVECAKPAMRAKMLQVLFENQEKWAFDADSKTILKNMGLLAGISEAAFNQCQNDKTAIERILQGTNVAAKVLEITATPSLIVNGQKLEGPLTPAAIMKAVGE